MSQGRPVAHRCCPWPGAPPQRYRRTPTPSPCRRRIPEPLTWPAPPPSPAPSPCAARPPPGPASHRGAKRGVGGGGGQAGLHTNMLEKARPGQRGDWHAQTRHVPAATTSARPCACDTHTPTPARNAAVNGAAPPPVPVPAPLPCLCPLDLHRHVVGHNGFGDGGLGHAHGDDLQPRRIAVAVGLQRALDPVVHLQRAADGQWCLQVAAAVGATCTRTITSVYAAARVHALERGCGGVQAACVLCACAGTDPPRSRAWPAARPLRRPLPPFPKPPPAPHLIKQVDVDLLPRSTRRGMGQVRRGAPVWAASRRALASCCRGHQRAPVRPVLDPPMHMN